MTNDPRLLARLRNSSPTAVDRVREFPAARAAMSKQPLLARSTRKGRTLTRHVHTNFINLLSGSILRASLRVLEDWMKNFTVGSR